MHCLSSGKFVRPVEVRANTFSMDSLLPENHDFWRIDAAPLHDYVCMPGWPLRFLALRVYCTFCFSLYHLYSYLPPASKLRRAYYRKCVYCWNFQPQDFSRVLKRSKLTNAPSRPVVEWRKHGLICICLPQANPGPPLALADLRPPMPQTGIVPRERPLPADGISYSREELFSLGPRRCALDVRAHFHQRYGLLRYQGPRTNNRGRNNTRIRPIPTIVNYRADRRQHCGSHIAENLRLTRRSVNFGSLRSVNKLWQHKVYSIPTILSTNVRSLPKKVEEIQQLAELNSAGAICITESWLSTDIPDSCVTIVICPKP